MLPCCNLWYSLPFADFPDAVHLGDLILSDCFRCPEVSDGRWDLLPGVGSRLRETLWQERSGSLNERGTGGESLRPWGEVEECGGGGGGVGLWAQTCAVASCQLFHTMQRPLISTGEQQSWESPCCQVSPSLPTGSAASREDPRQKILAIQVF